MSLEKPTPKEAEAMVRLQGLPDFVVFMTMIAESSMASNERLIKAPDLSDRDEHILIGELRHAARLTDAVAQSKSTLQQHKQPKS